jgi:hypothetical protein
MNQNSPSNDDVKMYKQMIMMDQAHDSYEDSTRSEDFLGISDNPPMSPYNSKNSKVVMNGGQPHKWGAPQSSEQYRPDDWMTGGTKSPLSAKRSYHTKSPLAIKSPLSSALGKTSSGSASFRGMIPSLDLDNTAHSATRTRTAPPVPPSMSSPASYRSPRGEVKTKSGAASTPTSTSRWGSGSNHSQSTTATPPTKGGRPPSTPVSTGRKTMPPEADPISKLQAESGTKIFLNEKIDTENFVSAFAAFEANSSGHNTVLTPRREKRQTSPRTTDGGSTSTSRRLISTPKAACRNFAVPAFPSSLSRTPLGGAGGGDGTPTYELANLSSLIGRLRKVSLLDDAEKRNKKNSSDRSDQQAAYLLDIMRQLRKVNRTAKEGNKSTAEEEALANLIANLRKTGVLNPKNLSPDDVSEIQQIIGRLRTVQERYSHKDSIYTDLQGVIRDLESVLVPSNTTAGSRTAVVAAATAPIGAGSSSRNNNIQETLEDAISRLKKVSPRLTSRVDKTETEHVTVALSTLLDRLKDRDEEELANAIRLLGSNEGTANEEENDGLKELRRVLATLDASDDTAEEEVKRLLAKLKLSPEDAEFVVNCLHRLKKVNMTPNEANAVAGVAAQLRSIDDTDGESDLDEHIDTLRDVLYPKQKTNEVTKVLQSLRRIDMTAPERKIVADVISKLGNRGGNNFTDVLADVISKLRRAKLNKYEAQEAAGILINLRKTKYPDNDNDMTMERVALRKVLTSEKVQVIDEVVKQVKKVHWNMDDAVFEIFVDDILSIGKGEPTMKQHCQNELADAISKLKKVKMSPREAKAVSCILFNLKKTKYPESKAGDKKDDAWKLRKVVAPEKVKLIDEALDRVKSVRWNLDDEVFEFFVGDVVSLALKDCGDDEDDDGSVGTMDVSISDDESEGDWKNVSSPHDRNDSSNKKPPAKVAEDKNIVMKTTLPKAKYNTKVMVETEVEEDEERKIVFTRKHHWKHKQHHATVIGEKRWRTSERFANDEVIFSPLSQEQYDRRKAVGASLMASMGESGVPLEDESHVDEVERKLQENDLTLGLIERHASSSKRSALVNKSPKKSPKRLSQSMVNMTLQPDFPSL